MGSIEDPMDYSGTSFNEWLVGIYSTKIKANKALKKYRNQKNKIRVAVKNAQKAKKVADKNKTNKTKFYN